MTIELITTPAKTLRVDVVPSYTLNGNAEQTEYAVEDGSSRTDHKILKPLELEIEIAQSEQPINDDNYSPQALDYEVEEVRTRVLSPFLLAGGAVVAAVGAIAGAVFGGKEAKQHKTYQTSSPKDRGGELQDELLKLLNSESDLVSVTLKGKTYTDLSLISLGASGAASEKGLTRFRCSFRAIDIATLETVALPNPENLAHVEPKKTGKNKPDTDEADKKVGGKSKSLLAAGLDLF